MPGQPFYRVLLVDDDEDDFRLTRKLTTSIEACQFQIEWASSYEAGLTALLTNPDFDICLLDYRLGAGDGLELLRTGLVRGCKIPIIMLTSQSDRSLDLEAMRLGAADYLVKGMTTPAVLERAIRYAVERRRAADALVRAREELEVKVQERTVELRRREDELRAMLTKAEEANRLKDEFLATVSHELRTPLSAILGYAELLTQEELSPKEHAEFLQIIWRNATAQAQLIGDLLDVSRIISGRLALQVGPVDLRAIVAETVEAVRLAAESRNLAVAIEVASDAAFVAGDAARLQQVLWNLVTNAIKFTPSGGRVTVSAARRDGSVEIAVTDTGEGIETQFLPYVFDRFRQEDARTTRRHGGLGLGLSIVRHLVELHGGTVAVASGGKGKGTAFTVRLPLLSAPRAAQRAPKQGAAVRAQEERPVLDGVRVLVIDDAEDSLKLVSKVLRRHGAAVLAAESAAAAHAILKIHKPDVIVSDIGMPDEDGYTFMRKRREWERVNGAERIPAAALSAYVRDEERTEALMAGFERHLSKPVDTALLVKTVAGLARGHAESLPQT